VNAAFRVRWSKHPGQLEFAQIAYGGVAATPTRLKNTEKLLEKVHLDHLDIAQVTESLHAEITPLSDLRSSAAFRRVTAENLLRQFIEELRS
jgi:xanthine dehydrogenase small subunit